MGDYFPQDGIREHFRRPFVEIIAREMVKTIRMAQGFGSYSELSNKSKESAKILIEQVEMKRKNTKFDIPLLGKALLQLQTESILEDIMFTSLLFHPHKEAIEQYVDNFDDVKVLYTNYIISSVYDNIHKIIKSNYKPKFNPEYEYLSEIGPSGPLQLSINIEERRYQYVTLLF